MKIGGFQKFSLVELPGFFSSVIFTLGCNLRCQFCYVPHLVIPEKFPKEIEEKEIFRYLKKNKENIDIVMITGGEPTLQKDLKQFCKKIKELNIKVGIETNGTNPDVIKDLISEKLIDYIAMDVKTVLDYERYKEITQTLTKQMFENIKRSIKLIIKSNIDHEFRTTVIREFHKFEDLIEIAKTLKGGKKYYIQTLKFLSKEFVGNKKLTTYKKEELEKIIPQCNRYIKTFIR